MAALWLMGSVPQDSEQSSTLIEAGIAWYCRSLPVNFKHHHNTSCTELIACILYKLTKAAHSDYCREAGGKYDEAKRFEDWCEDLKLQSPQFSLWFLVLAMELGISTLIISFREANFALYCEALTNLIPTLLLCKKPVKYNGGCPFT